jgi:hypothetical protein
MKQEEFLFDFSMEQILLLTFTWADRKAKMWGGGGDKKADVVRSKAHPNATPGGFAAAVRLPGFSMTTITEDDDG